MELFKSYEVAEYFGIPKPTAANWSKAKGTWRRKHYDKLQQVMAAELAEKAKGL
jgi:hypothetical protein